jgi:hypothetical protein
VATNTCPVCAKRFARLDRHMPKHEGAGATPRAATPGQSAPSAPDTLTGAGLALWTAVVDRHQVAPHLLPVLIAACRETARAERAEADVERDGAYTTDRYGAQKPHPGIAVARSSRLAAARLLRQLDLEPAPAAAVTPPPLVPEFSRPA